MEGSCSSGGVDLQTRKPDVTLYHKQQNFPPLAKKPTCKEYATPFKKASYCPNSSCHCSYNVNLYRNRQDLIKGSNVFIFGLYLLKEDHTVRNKPEFLYLVQ